MSISPPQTPRDEVPEADWAEQQAEAEPTVDDVDVLPQRPASATGFVEADEADLIDQATDVAFDDEV